MGQYDIFVYGGIALVGGWYVISHPEFLSSLFPPVTDPGTDPDPPDDGSNEGDNSGDGGYDCKKACKNCWCKSYNEKCGGSCSKCKGGNRILEKCGAGVSESAGKFDSGGGSSSGGSSGGGSSKAEICGDLCRRKECSTYKKTCSGNCKYCTGSSGCSSMCSSAQCGSYKAAGCSKSSCSNCSWAFATNRMIGNFPYMDEMRLTIA